MKSLKIFLTFFLVMLFCENVFSQTNSDFKRSLFFEAGGSGGVYSFNYESKLLPWSVGNRPQVMWNVGFEVVPIGHRAVLTFPVSVHLLFGKTKNKFEIGTGQFLALSILDKQSGTIRGNFHIGYRHQVEGKKIYWKIAYTPMYSYAYNFQWENWFGFGIGYRFKK